jgi:hypothetical protein
MQGIFSFSQSGEVLTVRAPRDGKDWMKSNPREDDQRWGAINAAMAVLASSKTTPDRMMLEQYQALVQPTQFIELLRKTMPMTEAQLDMFTTTHDSMFRRLNAFCIFWEPGTFIHADPRPGFQRSTTAAAADPGAQMWEMPQIGLQDGKLPFRLVTEKTIWMSAFWNILFYLSM